MSILRPLLFKAWRESRGRFLISAGLLAAICVSGVFCRDSLMKAIVPDERFAGDAYVGYIYALVYAGKARGLFVIMTTVLALGGLQREYLQRTLGFTLALPVSRAQLIGVQAWLGLGQVAILSALPLGCSDLFGGGGTGPVCVQITGVLAKADWLSVEPARRRDARRQGR